MALVILAGVGAAGAGDGRALEAAASWSAPRPGPAAVRGRRAVKGELRAGLPYSVPTPAAA